MPTKEEKGSAPLDQLNQDVAVDLVRSSTSNILVSFKEKLQLLRGNSEITEKVLRIGFDSKSCLAEANKFFGSDNVRYLAVDGTEFQEERLDLMIFFAGAYAYAGSLEFSETQVVSNPPASQNDFLGLSCAIPLSEEHSSKVSGELTEGGIETDSARVPQALMHLAEYYLAYTALLKDAQIKVLLVDRSVSGDIAHISWKLREWIAQGNMVLQDLKTSHGVISRSDLELGRMLVHNQELKLPPQRSQYLKYAAIQALIQNGPMNCAEIIQKLDANVYRRERLFKDLKDHFADCFSEVPLDLESKFVLNDSVKTYWERLMEGLEYAANHIFNPPANSHPLRLLKGAQGDEGRSEERMVSWITCEDIDYFTLLTIYALLKEAWKRNILILGIVKDTAASELVNAVLPVLKKARLLEFKAQIPNFNSDKMLLQTNSVVNSGSVKTPWRTFEYDVCFRTISPLEERQLQAGECAVNGAFKNVITSERMFVKAYFQLWASENDPSVRSHVFLYDRPCYGEYDLGEGSPELVLRNHDVAEETIVPALHFLKSSRISDLVLGILHSMGLEPIPEAIGHNYPLFLADKKAKWLENEASKACVAAVELEVAKSKLDQQILYERKFRDYRSGLESNRKSKQRKRS